MIYATAKRLGSTPTSKDIMLGKLEGVIGWDELIDEFT